MNGSGIFESLDVSGGFLNALPDQRQELLEAIREKSYQRAYALLKKLDEPLCAQHAGECLSAALHCSPELFRAVLEHCAPGEHGATEQWKLGSATRYVNVTGTILTLAAAMNKVAHMRILLRRGWDVNSDSPASAQALLCLGWNGQPFFAPDALPGGGVHQSRLTFGAAEYNSFQKTIAKPTSVIDCCTPLAAAILCGSEDAVRLLLRQKGVRKESSGAVCAAALAALRESPEQRACVRLAFRLKSDMYDVAGMRRELLTEHTPELSAIAEACNLREFTQRLKGKPCTREQLRAAADVLMHRNCKMREKKMLRMVTLYPELCEEQDMRDDLLNLSLYGWGGQSACDELLRCWKKACGEVRDISGMAQCRYDRTTRVGICREMLAGLREGGVLCAAAESAWLEDWNDKPHLTALTEYIHFYRAAPKGISRLAMLILDHGDAKFLKEMLRRGVLDGESREEMIGYITGKTGNLMLRATLLAAPLPPQTSETREEMPKNGVFWSARLKHMDQEQLRAWVREAWEKPLDADACRERLDAIRLIARHPFDAFGIPGGFGMVGQTLWQDRLDDIEFNSVAAAACCGRNPELLRVLLERSSFELQNRIFLSWQMQHTNGLIQLGENLNGNPLCAAAAAGRTEQVRLLLDAGYDPNEADMPSRSTYNDGMGFGETRVVTPLYMALEKGHSETARLLRERGGVVWPVREEKEACCG